MNNSIIDVAKRAGVSKSTVSRVLTGGSVSEKSRTAVYQAMQELNYAPNQMAQGLRGARTKVAGVVLNLEHALLSSFMDARIAGINCVLAEAGYSLLLINCRKGAEGDTDPFRFLKQNFVDGLIFLGEFGDETWKQKIREYRPVIYTGERYEKDRGFRVYMGNYYYSQDMYACLMNNGHRRILTIFDIILGKNIEKIRQNAYAEVCRKFGVSSEPNSFISLKEMNLNNWERLEYIYKKFVEGAYTAIFAESMELANQIVNYFSLKGLNLLEDYSIVAIERGGIEGKKDPTITAVCLPDFEYGVKCADLLLQVLKDESLTYGDIVVPYQLEIRRSVKNIL